jgi:hypothetical protein
MCYNIDSKETEEITMEANLKYYVAKARVWPYNSFYFTRTGTDFPVLDVVNPADYNIYEVTKEEYELKGGC